MVDRNTANLAKTDAQIREELGQRVVAALMDCGVPQAQIAENIGADPALVSRWAKGHAVPGEKYLPRLPGALGISGHWLLTGEGEMVPTPPEVEGQAFRQIAAIVDAARSPEGVSGLLARVDVAVSGQPSAPPETKDQGPKEGHG